MFEIYLLTWIIIGLICTLIGIHKNRAFVSFLLGFTLGIFGLIITILLSKKFTRECKYCGSLISDSAIICPYCKSDLFNTNNKKTKFLKNNLKPTTKKIIINKTKSDISAIQNNFKVVACPYCYKKFKVKNDQKDIIVIVKCSNCHNIFKV